MAPCSPANAGKPSPFVPAVGGDRLADLWQQVLLEEAPDLGVPLVHDGVDAEVEVALVKSVLQNLAEARRVAVKVRRNRYRYERRTADPLLATQRQEGYAKTSKLEELIELPTQALVAIGLGRRRSRGRRFHGKLRHG